MSSDVETLQNQLEFMRKKLEESRGILETLPIAYARTSTQGEKVLKRNAAFSAYEELLSSYCKTLREYRELTNGSARPTPQLVKFQKFADSMKKAADEG